jgi:hypothetical protein
MMTRFALASLAVAALFWAPPASAHGCHRGWQQAPKEGWHSHGPNCDPRHRIGVTRAKQRGKRRAG